MFDVSRRIEALEYAIQYTPGSDDNFSHCVLLEMLDELRSAGQKGELCTNH